MIIWDGSPHAWLEERGPQLCLQGAVDDATGQLLAGAHFEVQECAAGYLRVLAGIVRAHGVPWSAYMDQHSSLKRNDDYWTLEEELSGQREPTQVGRALQTLGVEVIYALSPQANDYVSHCTSLIPCDTMPSASRRVDSLTPCALRGGLLPGGSYKESFLSL